ncbi:MAG: DUF6867 family protein [Bacteroidota bacterium]
MFDKLYETGPNGLWVFLLVTVIIGGSGAFISGRAIAQTWRPFWHVPVYMLLLAAAVRFFHYALFWEVLFSLRNYVVDFTVALVCAALGYRITRARQMAEQYGWLYARRRVDHG